MVKGQGRSKKKFMIKWCLFFLYKRVNKKFTFVTKQNKVSFRFCATLFYFFESKVLFKKTKRAHPKQREQHFASLANAQKVKHNINVQSKCETRLLDDFNIFSFDFQNRSCSGVLGGGGISKETSYQPNDKH